MALAGDVVTPAMIDHVVARGRRTTNSTGTTSQVGVLRLDDVPVFGGFAYYVFTSALFLVSTTSGDGVGAYLRYTTDGSTPTTSSTIMHQTTAVSDSTSIGATVPLNVLYIPSTNQTLSVLLTVIRHSGTGTVTMVGGGSNPIDLVIARLGTDPGDTGTDI